MTLSDYCRMRSPKNWWRRRARGVILEIIAASGDVSPSALIAAVNNAYPFFERRNLPYKGWLAERKLFLAALAGQPELPTRDEADACEVARDMVLEGRLDDARRALELAPNRLARPCPACGVKPGQDCYEPADASTVPARQELAQTSNTFRAAMSQSHVQRALLVPHHARLVGHLDAGPLFITHNNAPLGGENGSS